MKDKKHLLILLVPVIVILVSAIFILRSVFTPDELIFTGMFETKIDYLFMYRIFNVLQQFHYIQCQGILIYMYDTEQIFYGYM